MNPAMLEHIERAGKGILATILRTEGHTYKKAGENALFEVENPFPRYGNLGSQCADQEILRKGKEAYLAKTPKRITIDTSDATDVHLGYGTYCGGMMEILLEPIFEIHKKVFRQLATLLAANETAYLCHHLETGEMWICSQPPAPVASVYVEEVSPRPDLFVVGATPLARQLIHHLSCINLRIHIIDWRAGHLAQFEGMPDLTLHEDRYPFDERSLVLVLTHIFERDKEALKKALSKKCAYVGLLSSKSRRDKLYEQMAAEGVSAQELERVSSPVGIDIHAKTDPEIAVGIAAEIVGFLNLGFLNR